MINGFQRMLYILGTISPYTIIASICLGIRISHSEYKNWLCEWAEANHDLSVTFKQQMTVVCSAIPYYIWFSLIFSTVVLIYHILFLKISLRNLPQMDFYASGAPEENDGFAQGLGAAYLFPIIEWSITANIFDYEEQVSVWFLFGVGVAAFLIGLFANKSYGSPVYWIMGYHFHTVQTEGSKPYILMSKTKHFRNQNQVKRVIRLFEDLLIDVS